MRFTGFGSTALLKKAVNIAQNLDSHENIIANCIYSLGDIALAQARRSIGGMLATVRRKLSALSSLFDYLCERNAVAGNPVNRVKRPMANGNEGSTPALGDAQAACMAGARASRKTVRLFK